MSLRINIPISIRDGMKSKYIIVIEITKDKLIGYENINGKYIYTEIPKGLKHEVDDRAFIANELHAKIMSVESSITMFGMAQRVNDFDGSILRVVQYQRAKRIEEDVFTLQTLRQDSVRLPFLRKDLRFIYPTVYQQIPEEYSFKPKDKVIAIKQDECKTFQKGEEFTVVDIISLESEFREPSLILKNKEREIITYTKYFKKK